MYTLLHATTYQVGRCQLRTATLCVLRESLCFYSYLLLAAEAARPAFNIINFSNQQTKRAMNPQQTSELSTI